MRLRRAGTDRARPGLSLICSTGLHARKGAGSTPEPADSGAGREADGRPDVVVVGAHGGAGASTLAMLLRPAWDMGAACDPDPAYPPVHAFGRPLIVVCRSTVPAALHATQAVTALHLGGEPVTALVVVSDGAGPEPRDAAARFDLLQDRVNGIVRMPFIPGLRLVDDPQQVALPAKAHWALAQIRDLADTRPPSDGDGDPP